MKLQLKQVNISIILIEVILIVLGVLLGLFVNEWRIKQENQKQATVAYEQIIGEINSNKANIEQLVDYHAQISDSLRLLRDRVISGERLSLSLLFYAMPNGFSVPYVSDNAWKTANVTGIIKEFDYEVASRLSNVYSLQNYYMSKFTYVEENLYLASNIDMHSGDALITGLSLLANDVRIHGKDLLSAYNSVIERSK